MVSVLPPHIAFEMKNEMIRKTRKAQMKSLLAHEESFNQSETKNVCIFYIFYKFYVISDL